MSRHSLETKIGAVTLRNPVLLASGPAGYGLEYEGMIDLGPHRRRRDEDDIV